MTDEVRWQWTSKAFWFLAGIVLVVVGAILNRRGGRAALVGLAITVAGILVLIYSTMLHEWCAPVSGKFGTLQFGTGFYREVSVWDCVHLVYRGI